LLVGLVPGVGLTPTDTPDKDDVSRALHLARKSTASLGKFTQELPKEKPAKHVGKKRKVRHLRKCICHYCLSNWHFVVFVKIPQHDTD